MTDGKLNVLVTGGAGLGADVETEVTPTDDNRSYHVSLEKILCELRFTASRAITEAVRDLAQEFADAKVPDPMTDSRYFNNKLMQKTRLK